MRFKPHLAAALLMMLALTCPPALADHCGRTVVIEPGDTLSSVAQRCGTQVNALLRGNPYLGDPRSLAVGVELVVPGHGSSTSSQPQSENAAAQSLPAYLGTYVVSRGENLHRIARKFGLSTAYLRAINPGLKGDYPRSGTTIQLRPLPGETDADSKLATSSGQATR